MPDLVDHGVCGALSGQRFRILAHQGQGVAEEIVSRRCLWLLSSRVEVFWCSVFFLLTESVIWKADKAAAEAICGRLVHLTAEFDAASVDLGSVVP